MWKFEGSMKTVVLRGPVFTLSGYGTHCRQIARWLLEKGVDFKIDALQWGMTPWLLDPTHQNGFIGDLMKRASPTQVKPDVSIQVQLPNEWNQTLANYNVGVTAGVETDKCNPQWVTACNAMQKVIVPSKHTLACLLNTATLSNQSLRDVDIVPESFIDECLLPPSTTTIANLNFSTDFNFLVFGQLTGNNKDNDRKSIMNTVQWLLEEFRDNKNVGIILKINAGKNSLMDRETVVRLVNELAKLHRVGVYPKIHLVHGHMSDNDVASLYYHPKVKALITATRGEGFGLPILEAAACGLPVIATGWSAHTEFLSLGKYIKLQYVLNTVHQSRIDNNIFVEGAKWAEVDEIDFKKKTRKFYEKPEIPKRWAQDLSSLIRENYSFSAISKRYDDVIGSIIL